MTSGEICFFLVSSLLLVRRFVPLRPNAGSPLLAFHFISLAAEVIRAGDDHLVFIGGAADPPEDDWGLNPSSQSRFLLQKK